MNEFRGFIRLTLISISVLFGAFLAVFFLRFWALQQPLKPADDWSFQKPTLLVSFRGGSAEAPENTLAAIENSLESNSKIMIQLDLQLTKDNRFVVMHDQNLAKTTKVQGHVREMTLDELKKIEVGQNFHDAKGTNPYKNRELRILGLQEVLQRFPNASFLLNVRNDLELIDEYLINEIETAKAEKRVIIHSEYSVVANRIKKLRPKWLMGSARADRLRYLLLAKLYLEPVASLYFDVYVDLDESATRVPLLTRAIEELQRRGIKIFVPKTGINDFPPDFADGWMTDRPRQDSVRLLSMENPTSL